MKVTFIKHSSYFVELHSCCLLFDYTEGAVPETEKPLYVFASHSHGDHFSPAVFNLPGKIGKPTICCPTTFWKKACRKLLEIRWYSSRPTRLTRWER